MERLFRCRKEIREPRQIVREALTSGENISYLGSFLAISGDEGSGKSTVARRLQKILNIEELIEAGDLQTKILKARAEGPVRDGVRADKEIDDTLTEAIVSGRKVIVDARLSAHIVNKERNKMSPSENFPKGITIVYKVSPEDGATRVMQRQNAARQEANVKRLTLKETLELNRRRRSADRERWKDSYPAIKDYDTYDPEAVDAHGKRIYDISLSTTGKTVDEVVEDTLVNLLEHGFIKIEKRRKILGRIRGPQVVFDPRRHLPL